MVWNGSVKNSSSFKLNLLKSIIRLHLMSCCTEKKKKEKENLLKSTKGVPVEIQQQQKH